MLSSVNWGTPEGLGCSFRKQGFTWHVFFSSEVSPRSRNSSSPRWVVGARVPHYKTETHKGHVHSSSLKALVSEKSDFTQEEGMQHRKTQEESYQAGIATSPSLSPGDFMHCPITLLCGSPFFIDPEDDRHFLLFHLLFGRPNIKWGLCCDYSEDLTSWTAALAWPSLCTA